MNYDRLRRGLDAWPATVAGSDDDRKIDDMWHAAINSRGQFFTASSPQELVSALTNIIASIIARKGSSTPATISIPLITDSTTAYKAGYDTTDWSGTLTRVALDPVTGADVRIATPESRFGAGNWQAISLGQFEHATETTIERRSKYDPARSSPAGMGGRCLWSATR